MFYDFLWERKNSDLTENNQKALSNLQLMSDKTEEMLENIYRKIDSANSKKVIAQLDDEIRAKKFWIILLHQLGLSFYLRTDDEWKNKFDVDKEDYWFDYIVKHQEFIHFDVYKKNESEEKNITLIKHTKTGKSFGVFFEGDKTDLYTPNLDLIKKLQSGYEAFISLELDKKVKIIKEITY